MADIELVIKVDERDVDLVRKNFKSMGYSFIPLHIQTEFVSAILNGTPLPKGHERLADADIIKDFKNKIKHYGKDYRFTQEEILNILERYEIKYAPTIIEADTKSGEQNQ